MRKIPTFLLALVFCISAIGQIPVMTMTTEKSIGSSFSFSLNAVADNTPIQVDFGDGALVSKTIGISQNIISGNLIGSQTVKIYGTGITVLSCGYNQLSALDISANNALINLDCQNNLLTTLDVTKNTALMYLNISDNKLTSADLSKNTALLYLYCYSNKLAVLNVSANSALTRLSCSNNQLATLDISANIALKILNCENNVISTLDVSKNISLTTLDCSYNLLTAIDVTKNNNLEYFECEHLLLHSLDVSNNNKLTELWCGGNQLTFTTLPFKQTTWTHYSYTPQAPISMVKSLKTGDEIDLSNQLTINGNTTVYTWKIQGGTVLAKGTDYTINNGKTIFLEGQADSVYCEMTNATFPDFVSSSVLKTTNTEVIGINDPVITMTTAKAIGSDFSFSLGCEINNTLIFVDFGDGNLVPQTIANHATTISGQIVGSQTVKIYGKRIYILKCSYEQVIFLDVTKNISLDYLDCSNNQLTTLDLSMNNALSSFRCDNNQFTSLNVTHNINLGVLGCSHNQLTSLDVSKNIVMYYFMCDANKLVSLDITNNKALRALYCRNNKLTSLDLTNNSILQALRCDSNQLNTLDVSKNTALISLTCSNNFLTFATLPIKQTTWIDYDYAPQAAISAVKSLEASAEIDLSSQLMINGNVTAYTWKTPGGTMLAEGTDYTITDGKTIFLKAQSDSVYCEMTNAAHPTFVGSYALKTTNIKILSGISPTGVDKANNNGPCIYPNPVINSLFIKNSAGDKLQIYDARGRNIMAKQMYNHIENIDVSALPEGLYIVRIGNQQIKLVKQ